ncbi:hypothetical protein D3OALGB2SA_2166 [Olavius algarvensis associated proteobacterium Delta 3]|nr:hypothetical protein D3OALGB2SA_2166 [Olavius algarvensis associated proteobacterium Delta 3]
MTSSSRRTADIIENTESSPGVRAGIVGLDDVLEGLSYRGASEINVTTCPTDDTFITPWLPGARWVLVLGLQHPADIPELDWWEGGNTRGNRRLMDITDALAGWLAENHGLDAQPLPYSVEKGGLFLKDAAVLSGLGIIGRNNLLIHPEWGPQIRFRAMLIAGDLLSTQPFEGFDPCSECDRFCQKACPQRAFARGRYIRDRCLVQMNMDVARSSPEQRHTKKEPIHPVIKYCRACELACPVGQGATGG